MAWEAAERVQKNEAGEYRALIGGEWVPVVKAQKNPSGQFRVERATTQQPKQEPFVPSGEKTSGWVGGLVGYDPKALGITPAENIAGHPLTRFAMGAAGNILGAGQLGAEAIGFKAPSRHLERVEQLKQAGMKATGAEGVDIAGIAGQATGPVAMGAMNITPAATLGGRALQGTAIGAGFGGTTPVTDGEGFWGTKAAQTATGALLGGLVPVTIGGVKYLYDSAKRVLEPVLPGGVERQASKMLTNLAGDKRQEIESLLAQNKVFVPGSQPTAAEAASPAGSAEFSSLERLAKMMRPSQFDKIAQTQEKARLAAVQGVGKDKATLAAAEAQRLADSIKNYGAAYQQAVKADPRLAQIASNPYFKDAIPDAVKLSEAAGISAKTDLTRFLHFVKISIDKQIAKTGDSALSATERKAAVEVKKQLLEWMKVKNPLYNQAREAFKKASAPINEMQVGQELEKALTKPLGVGERPAVFANAMREAPRTIKKATGQSVAEELDEVLTPQNLANVKNVLADLSRRAETDRLSGLGAFRASKIEEPFQLPATGPLHQKYMIFKTVLGRVSKNLNDKTIDLISKSLEVPTDTLRLMQMAPPAQQQAMADALARKYVLTATAASAREIGD